ncbi:phage distal tail protein [Actinosynnema mirum]|uniref:Siphovirus-type tail component C-terminal domain-containing protein n=1 Tax=Actinosynnema mirum (strain ATCC 29888 / DSM 43827 / JCM 3225 / NBRC 14064 / NCIMB 13271 / NRRL B-12336 / IMRU 3971 / 101) TaxID=446462 RepID=C6WC64_ACTMD|nr:hypothetical protein [Actinosynnema mirum]ACU39452.1 hypothetical protein Amir_5636 [Actinosynnema mirum DSM 43827]
MPTPLLHPSWSVDGWMANGRDDDGTEWIVERDDGWWRAPGVRGQSSDRVGYHGAYSDVQQWATPRVVTLAGWCQARTEEAADRAVDRFGALLRSGARELVVTEPVRTKRSLVRREADPQLVRTGPRQFDWQIVLVADDPIRYGDPVLASTGLPMPGGGLDWEAGLGAVMRTNLARNTVGVASSVPWTAYNAGSAVTSEVYSTVIPGLDARRALARATCTTAGTIGLRQPVLRVVGGQQYSAALWARCTAARSAQLEMRWTDSAGGFVSSTASAPVALAAGTWTRLELTALAPGTATGLLVCPLALSAAPGDLLDATALLVERGATLGGYFDGSSAGGYWSGEPWGSVSHDAPVGLDWESGGGLDWGTPASNGSMALINMGTAEVWPVYTITGPATQPRLYLPSTGETLLYSGTLAAADTLVIDSHPHRQSAWLNGVAERFLLQADWWAVPPTSTATTVAFASEDTGPTAATATASVSPGWW